MPSASSGWPCAEPGALASGGEPRAGPRRRGAWIRSRDGPRPSSCAMFTSFVSRFDRLIFSNARPEPEAASDSPRSLVGLELHVKVALEIPVSRASRCRSPGSRQFHEGGLKLVLRRLSFAGRFSPVARHAGRSRRCRPRHLRIGPAAPRRPWSAAAVRGTAGRPSATG